MLLGAVVEFLTGKNFDSVLLRDQCSSVWTRHLQIAIGAVAKYGTQHRGFFIRKADNGQLSLLDDPRSVLACSVSELMDGDAYKQLQPQAPKDGPLARAVMWAQQGCFCCTSKWKEVVAFQYDDRVYMANVPATDVAAALPNSQ